MIAVCLKHCLDLAANAMIQQQNKAAVGYGMNAKQSPQEGCLRYNIWWKNSVQTCLHAADILYMCTRPTTFVNPPAMNQ